ncbi:hypothetical protein [Helicobacter cetorum]|uniref:Uncharacterized protein n=1 Tax=Helicobacter cetorum (strain ATCC BAA-540 / CCUG 52418 / MIT 99-5656) TaxID=1163745 RepID=I0EUI1_HELCM|nr:hypothetical protein [Helicobacter cetorum]AFI05223.1 hypothetical protein HCD_00955 [Helicobacter cetorum MIT 99-5656]AFI06001.1 hypothetical protein HCD_04995 [Helicobacter cetorum MIT 99-5656]AFI06600.1 hypothetical protein HCD_08080 [Helicobacter cetorum MIT 99-5656]
MNTTRFIRNFLTFKEALQTQNFNNKELNTICLQAAIQGEQIALQESQNKFAKEQAKARMELEFLSMQMQLQSQKAQTLNALIQCQSMLKSLKDNAAINRANAYVSLLQVAGSVGANNFANVVETINQIGIEYTHSSVNNNGIQYNGTAEENELNTILNKLSNELDKLNALGDKESIQLFSNELEVLVNEPTEIWGFSTLNNATEGFYNANNELLASGNSFLFSSNIAGQHTITFKASIGQANVSKSITISVIQDKLRQKQ